jgi:hypothetical protein
MSLFSPSLNTSTHIVEVETVEGDISSALIRKRLRGYLSLQRAGLETPFFNSIIFVSLLTPPYTFLPQLIVPPANPERIFSYVDDAIAALIPSRLR